MQAETIVALSSGALPAGIAVVRVSGPACRTALEALAGGVPEPRRAALRRIRDASGETIDRGLVLFFQGPATVTGEDLAEFHLHGGRAVVSACLEALTALPGVRLAEAGEFTRRAFENGRIDLTEAEGLADLLSAETEAQRRQAVAQSGGALRVLYEGWMGRLVHARAMLEASFDFADEGDVGQDVARIVPPSVAALIADMRAHLAEARRGEILRHGFRVAIVGPPNAGKSSLINALAEREVSIVTDIPGTTRDVVEVTLDLGGVAVRLVDTAGLRETEDVVEAIGVGRALAAAAEADLVLVLSERAEEGRAGVIHVKQSEESAGPEVSASPAMRSTLLWPAGHRPIVDARRSPKGPETKESLISILEGEMPAGRGGPTTADAGDRTRRTMTPLLRILTKSDLRRAPADRFAGETFDVAISTTSGEGLSDLVARIAALASDAAGDPSSAIPARTRHREIVADALAILDEATASGQPPEIVAETLRRATERLGALTGRVGVEDLLDVIFSAFCIGK